MFQLIFILLLITKIECQKICNNPKGCVEEQVMFKEPLRWCTVNNNEVEQCQNVAKVASSLGYHNITCVQRFSKSFCLESIKRHEADIVSVVNLPLGSKLDMVVTTTSDNNPVNLAAFDDSSCVFKLYYQPGGNIKGRYRQHSWTCPSRIFQKVLCDNPEATQCHYFNEIVMRTYDPHIENATKLLVDLWDVYNSENSNNNFGDLLFQGYTQSFYKAVDADDPPTPASIAVFALVGVGLLGGLLAFGVKKKFFKKAYVNIEKPDGR